MITRSRSSESRTPCISVVTACVIRKKKIPKTPKRKIKKGGKPSQTDESSSNISSPSKKSRLTLRAARRDSDSPNFLFTPEPIPEKYTPDVRQLLLHPDASAVEPYRVLCAKCLEWVTMTTKYHLSTFRVHTTLICKNRNAKGTHGETTKSDISVPSTSCGSVCSIISSTDTTDTADVSRDHRGLSWSKHRTEEERARILRDDPRTGKVEPRRVFCLVCERWIRLRDATTYCSTPWVVHIARCTKKNPVVPP